MTFTEKLKRLTSTSNRSEISRAWGLAPTLLSNYVNRGSIPRADLAHTIARALDVPLEWLVDDDQDWPPPSRGALATASLTDEELMTEVNRRFTLELKRIAGFIERVKAGPPAAVAAELLPIPFGDEIPADLQRKVFEITEVAEDVRLRRFDPPADGSMRAMGSQRDSREQIEEAVLAIRGLSEVKLIRQYMASRFAFESYQRHGEAARAAEMEKWRPSLITRLNETRPASRASSNDRTAPSKRPGGGRLKK